MARRRAAENIRIYHNRQNMTKNAIHFLYCPFTGLGLHGGFRGDKWLKNRIKVFKQFVLPSLMNQTKREFVLWVSWRPEEKNNPIVDNFRESLERLRGLSVVFTYGGLCFYDDKYDDDTARTRLLGNLTATLPELKGLVGDSDEVFMTIQPSDDMYLSDFVESVHNKWPKDVEAMGFRKGYIIDYGTKELAEYNPDTTPPFATIRFSRDKFLDPEKHTKYTGPYKSHEYVKDHLKEGFWENRGFIVGTHGENISTTWNIPYRGEIITGEKKEKILLNAGIYFSDPIKVKKGIGLILREILNRLPFQKKIRRIYHLLPIKLKKL